MTLTAEAIERGLIATGVPQDKAHAIALLEAGLYTNRMPIAGPEMASPAPQSALPAPPYTQGVTLRIPWSALVSDNVKFRVGVRRKDGGQYLGAFILTPEYRAARDRIKALSADVMAGRPPYAVPLSLTARVWVPNNRRRDVVNFSKALHDAMNAVVYEDDCWLHETHWIRAGVDVDAPRCELTIMPI